MTILEILYKELLRKRAFLILLFSRPLNTIMEKSCSDESIICYSTHFTTLTI